MGKNWLQTTAQKEHASLFAIALSEIVNSVPGSGTQRNNHHRSI